MNNPQYFDPIKSFLDKSDEELLGYIFQNEEFSVDGRSKEAWISEIKILKSIFISLDVTENDTIFFEYTLPRVGGRIDCGIIYNNHLLIIEFKTGEISEDLEIYENQINQYVTDLKNYHFESHDAPIIPVLCISGYKNNTAKLDYNSTDKLYNLVVTNYDGLKNIIIKASNQKSEYELNSINWIRSPYCPTLNIIEAAQALFNKHTVKEINRSDAKGENLINTTNKIMDIIHDAQKYNKKYLCLVTGVPGAGKTLVGLSVATMHKNEEQSNRSVYLSGNHPLVTVLQEALTRDAVSRQQRDLDVKLASISDPEEKRQYKKDHKITKVKVRSEIKQFIQMIYLWRKEYLKGISIVGKGDNRQIVKDQNYYQGSGEFYLPYDHVAIFDEAQRTWNGVEHSRFVRNNAGIKDFPEWSEARFLMSCMDRHKDWAVVVCLIGNGQDINHGEAGVQDWIDSVSYFPDWEIVASERLKDEVDISKLVKVQIENDLHLSVNLRSLRAENVSRFVDYLLQPNLIKAAETLNSLQKYPMAVTRDFNVAKKWIKQHAHTNERYGVVACSKAQRLKPLAIDVTHSKDMNVEAWFLNGKKDIHSSYYMEDIATEFQVQGLEIDWACVAWDGDLLYKDGCWIHRQFRADGWRNINKSILQQYHLNAYRVLLTRARHGMIIFVPEGDLEDPTRTSEDYDSTYNYLVKIGLTEVK